MKNVLEKSQNLIQRVVQVDSSTGNENSKFSAILGDLVAENI